MRCGVQGHPSLLLLPFALPAVLCCLPLYAGCISIVCSTSSNAASASTPAEAPTSQQQQAIIGKATSVAADAVQAAIARSHEVHGKGRPLVFSFEGRGRRGSACSVGEQRDVLLSNQDPMRSAANSYDFFH